MSDPTEAARRALIPEMPEQLLAEARAGRPIWDTDQMREEFEVIGFLAPFTVVRRRRDGVTGSLKFVSAPERYYFNWQPDTGSV